MEIEKGKILEIWDRDHNRVVLYTQSIKNKELNEIKNITAKDLNSLLNKVRKQMEDWK